MNKRARSLYAVYGVACLPALLLAIDVGGRAVQDRRKYVLPPDRYTVPDDVLFPASAGYELKGVELQAFLAQRPLKPGAPAPRVDAIDFRGERVRIPSPDRKSVAWAVSDGSLEGAGVLHELVNLEKKVGDRLHIAAFVTTHSHYVWGHHGGTFGHTPLQVVRDEYGTYFRQMRPPGTGPAALPAVYACDGSGTIRYVEQPSNPESWSSERLQRALHLRNLPPGTTG
jgi:hypothetical protein